MSDNANQPPDYNQKVRDLIPAHQSAENIATVSPDDAVLSAFTQMVTYDYSQLPVVSDNRVSGVVKWNALAVAVCCTGSATEAKIKEYAEVARTIGIDDPVENAIEIVAKGDYAIVINGDESLAGILTASDLAVHLHTLTEPHANIQRIEKALRAINDYHFRKDGKVPSLGNQIKKLKHDWTKLCTKLDCATVIGVLKKANDTRDSLAHFKPPNIAESDRENLRRCAAMLEGILKCQQAQRGNHCTSSDG